MKWQKITAVIVSTAMLLVSTVYNFPCQRCSQNIAYATEKAVDFGSFDMSVNGGEPVRGVDISSILAIEKAGVEFYNENGKNRIFLRRFLNTA